MIIFFVTLLAFAPCIECFLLPRPMGLGRISLGSSSSSSSDERQTHHLLNDGKSSFTLKSQNVDDLFEDFSNFSQKKQLQIITEIESMDGSSQTFSNDRWGVFNDKEGGSDLKSGGITRVLQKGNVVEKGACSFTLIKGGKLTAERAASIQGRQKDEGLPTIQPGDEYCAAALSMVLHTKSPMIPTFRSDVRIFLVRPSKGGETLAWFGGGSDLTPYYLFDDDITFFHKSLNDLCLKFRKENDDPCNDLIDYHIMKQACDDYFYLPARSEHRGTGGMFFDDIPADASAMNFVKAVAENWMPSWFPIVEKRRNLDYNDQQKEWQLLRRGRYLEFNLLYDRGVKFGLANANPRVEGVMVSAPPLIAWEYNHMVEKGSEEERLLNILKHPKNWV
jgi:Coproporphyrinogen III oxidase